MSPGVKAIFVIGGLFAFFLIPVVGPALSDGGNSVVQFVLGFDDETRVQNRKVREKKAYNSSGKLGPLGEARQCCIKCNADWNFMDDRCDLKTQATAACYTKTCTQ